VKLYLLSKCLFTITAITLAIIMGLSLSLMFFIDAIFFYEHSATIRIIEIILCNFVVIFGIFDYFLTIKQLTELTP